MNRVILILAALAAWTATAATPNRTATEAYVTNKIAAAIAALPPPDFSTNNAELVETIQDAAPVPDYSTNNAELVGTIQTKAPAPGDYATVSNRAMTALQSHQSLQPSTNYTDRALGAFASTGAVARAATYGTPTRWTDATGCVWEASVGWRIYTNGIVAVGWTAWSRAVDTGPFGMSFDLVVGLYENEENPRVANAVFPEGVAPHWGNVYEALFDWDYDFYGLTRGDTIRAARDETNLVGRVAMTNDIPDTSGYTTPEDVTAAIREQSLGGIWDAELEVWWTPRMKNGSLTYEATTNVNLNTEN